MSNYSNPRYPQDNYPYDQPYGQYPNVGGFPPFPQQQVPTGQPGQGFPITTPLPGASPFVEQSYIENILRLNQGKIATVYMNFENSQWGSKVFQGVVEAAGKDHIILSDPNTGMRYVLLMIYLNYITFDEEINYDYPFAVQPSTQAFQAPIFNVPQQPQQPPFGFAGQQQPPFGFPGQQPNIRKKDKDND